MHTQLMQIQITDTGTDIDTHTDTDVVKFRLLGCFSGIIYITPNIGVIFTTIGCAAGLCCGSVLWPAEEPGAART